MRNNALAVLDAETINQESPIKAALTCVQPIQKSALPTLRQGLELLQGKKNELFGCETEIAEQINRFMGILECRVKAINELPSKYPDLTRKYQYFDIKTALSFKDKDGLPSLAIYNIENQDRTFEFHYGTPYSDLSLTTELPPFLRELYYCVFTSQSNFSPQGLQLKGYSGRIVSTFRGKIPSECREVIIKSKDDFGNKIYIIAEASWRKVPSPDPIVVGIKDKHAWVITTFDLTSLEAEISKALTTILPSE